MEASRPLLVEICTEDVEGVRLAARAGADRAELCDNLVAGGTTPSIGAVESAIFAIVEEMERARAAHPAGPLAAPQRHTPFGLRVMIRPRGGDFVFSSDEGRAMMADVRRIAALAREMSEYTRPRKIAGHAPLPPLVEVGFVVGVLTREHVIDRGLLRLLVDTADGAPVTFNKAFDETRDFIEAYGDLGGLNVDYVLTSGGAPTALEGAEVLRGLVSVPGGPRVIAAGHVRPENVAEVIERSGVQEIHLRCSRDSLTPGVPQRTDEAKVRRAVEAAHSLEAPHI